MNRDSSIPHGRTGCLAPYFSVVIPTYNRAEKLRKTIQSVVSQSFSDFEILVIDDGSTDDTREMVSSFLDKRIRYDWAPNSGGPATPRNRGIDMATAEWICFLDADDIWYPDKLEHVVRVIKNNSELDVVCHDEMQITSATGETLLLRHGPLTDDFYRVMLTNGNRLSTSAVAVRREFLKCHSLRFNQSKEYVVVEDYDLWLRMAFCGAKFHFIRQPLDEYIIENDNLTGDPLRYRRNLFTLLHDHVYMIQNFEADREKLWRRVIVRLDIQEIRARIIRWRLVPGLSLLIATVIRSPRDVVGYTVEKLRRHFRSTDLGNL